MSNSSEIKLNTLNTLSLRPLLRRARHWWYKRAEEHYLICAAVEHERAREARDRGLLLVIGNVLLRLPRALLLDIGADQAVALDALQPPAAQAQQQRLERGARQVLQAQVLRRCLRAGDRPDVFLCSASVQCRHRHSFRDGMDKFPQF